MVTLADMAIPLTSDASSTPPPEGRPAVQELAELLLLRRRPAIVAVVGVLLLGVLLAVLAPGLVPASALTGVVVGLLALVAAFAAMLAVDAADPIVRGPRHVRVTGRTVVGRVDATPTPAQVAPVVDGIVAALSATRRLRMTVVGVEQDTSEVARLVAEGVAGAGRTVLLVDLATGSDSPGVTDVAAGTHRLGDVVRLEPGLQLAVTGSGTASGVPAAAARLAATPPSDLDLLLTVLPRDERPGSGLLAGTDRVLALVPLGVLERDEVSRQLALLEQARSTRAAVVVVDPPKPEPQAPDPGAEIRPFDDDSPEVVEDAPLFADEPDEAAEASSEGAGTGSAAADDETDDEAGATATDDEVGADRPSGSVRVVAAPVAAGTALDTAVDSSGEITDDGDVHAVDDVEASDDDHVTPVDESHDEPFDTAHDEPLDTAADEPLEASADEPVDVAEVPEVEPGQVDPDVAAADDADVSRAVPLDEHEDSASAADVDGLVDEDVDDVDDTTDLSDDTDRDEAAPADAAPTATAGQSPVEEESEEEESEESEESEAADEPVAQVDAAADGRADATAEVPVVRGGSGPDLSVRRDDDDDDAGDELLTTAALELLADERAHGE